MGRKRIAAALLALALTAGTLALPARAAFADTAGHWAETAITKWSEDYSVINGYEDGTFRPDNSITRGAFAGILDRFLKFRSVSPAGTFSDLSGNYWEEAILKLHAAGVYLGNNGAALAGDTITRQQAVTMIARAFGLVGETRGRPLSGRGSGGGVCPALSCGDVRQGLYHRLLRRLFPPHGPHHPGGDRDDPGQYDRGADPDQRRL